MDRKEIVLTAMAPAGGAQHSPVQMQKLLFLIDHNAADLLGGPFFNFAPYHYGPFDKTVYEVLEELESEGYVDTTPERTWKNYRLTVAGQEEADKQFFALPERVRNYLRRTSEFVRGLSFTQLVSAIYRAYPETRANSVFQG